MHPTLQQSDFCPIERADDTELAQELLEGFARDFTEGRLPEVSTEQARWASAVLWLVAAGPALEVPLPRLCNALEPDKDVDYRTIAGLIPGFIASMKRLIDARTAEAIREERRREVVPLTDDELPF